MTQDGDYITVNTLTGPKQAELVAKFVLKGFGDYILYRINEKIYGARYEMDGNKTKLYTNLSKAEQTAINEAYQSMEGLI